MKKISPNETNPEELTNIISESADGKVTNESYDYVIVAVPLHESTDPKLEIDFASFDQLNRLKMQRTNTYFVYGQVKLFPKLPTNKRLELFSVEPSLPCRSIATQQPCDYSRKDRSLFVKSPIKLYKIFAEQELGESEWEVVFEKGYQIVKYMPWLAYPKYESKIDFELAPPIILDQKERSRVLYLNALEWCASCMEMECVAARNLCNIIAEKETSCVKKIRFFNQPNRVRSYFGVSLSIILIANFAYLIYSHRWVF